MLSNKATTLRSSFAIALIVLSLTSCALSPQIIAISPSLQATQAPSAAGRSLVIEVVDLRASPVIGSRGGVYRATSTLTTESEFTARVRESLSDALRGYGFVVSPDGGSAQTRLRVEIEQLGYVAERAKLVTSIETSATVGVRCEVAGSTYTGRYNVKDTKQAAKFPDVEENERLVNASLSKTLNRLVNDQKLLDFMTN